MDGRSCRQQENEDKADDLSVSAPVQMQERLNEKDDGKKQKDRPDNHGGDGYGEVWCGSMHNS